MIRSLTVLSFVTLAACSTTIAEEPGTVTIQGNTYPTVTRTFQREDGSTYSRMTIRAGTDRVTCMPDDLADCRTALWESRMRDRD